MGETGTCYDGYFDANDPYGLDYYVDHLDGKWVSTDDYNDYYAGVDPEEYASLTHFDCWETGTCYDGYFDADDPNGLDYYVDHLDGKWVSTEDYNDYYAGVDPEEYASLTHFDCWETGTCYDGYFDSDDPNGHDYYVDHLGGKWVSTDDYHDTYAGVDPEDYVDTRSCWETGTCYDGYFDPNDPNGLDYYVDDYYVDGDYYGKWVSTDEYNDIYAEVDPEEYAGLTHFDCWETGTCYDGYFDADDPSGLDYYVDHLGGKWVSTDEYNDIYAEVDPEDYAEEPAGDQPTPITEPAAPGVNPIPGIGQAAGNVVTHG